MIVAQRAVPGGRLALAACLATLALPAGAARAAPGPTRPGAVYSRPAAVLSNETTRSTWTVADYSSIIRSAPTPRARGVGRLEFQTPDGFLQSYLLLRQRWTRQGAWVLLRIPGRPNGRVGWVRRGALDSFHRTNMQIVVDRESERLTLYRNGRAIFQAPVGTGKPSTPTPPGHFWITESFGGFGDPFYGPWAFGTSDYSTISDWPGGGIVGIHGTNEPQLVPGHPSHGCIRMHNGDVLTLERLLGGESAIGTPLLVK